MARRRLEVEIVGDASKLNRTLGRTETRLSRFGKAVDGVGSGKGMTSLAALRGGPAIAGVAALGLGMKKMIDAARESEVVLGQTSVAVNRAGIDWGLNAKRIDAAAQAISKSSSFDDESVLQSFQVFVRSQKDVEKSLKLASLAADVARGRYTDLDSATQLVNKASMGQVGALRRAGIQIDKNATSVQALAALEKAYGTSSETYSKSAAGGADRLRIAWENLAETAGGPLAQGLGEAAGGFAGLIEATDGALKSAQGLYGRFLEFQRGLGMPGIRKQPTGISDSIAASAARAGRRPGEGTGRAGVSNGGGGGGGGGGLALITQLSNRLASALLDAQRTKGTGDDMRVLGKQKAFLEKALGQKGLKPGQSLGLKQELAGVLGDIKAIQDDAAQNLRDAADRQKDAAAKQVQASKDAAAKQKRLAEEAKRKQVDAAQKLKDAAEKLKQGALDKLDLFKSVRDNARSLVDARTNLSLQRQIGGPEGIKLATRELEDAKLERQRLALQGGTYGFANGKVPQAVSGNAAGAVVININGTTLNQDQLTRAVLTALEKRRKTTSAQSRGRQPGYRPF